ncbi:MAG: chromosome segregation protein SMC, partial [Daejeonella sp.]
FDNTKNILPTDFSQVKLTRKLYRTGESEYRLNEVQCRLKDITDLFLDTGIGADSYSIIELKMIDEIITNKENSRRALFEEASGISKYKLRKKQTFNKLKDTEADLSRVEDLLFEIEKNLKTLENQAKKTERYYKLKEQYKALSISLASFRIIDFRESLNTLEDQEQKQAVEKTNIATQIDLLEAGLQQQKLDNLTQEKNLSAQQKAANEFLAKIRAYESDKKLKNEQLRFLEDKKERLTEELDKDKNQLNHVFYNQKRLNEEHVQESQTLELVKGSIESKAKELEEIRGKQLSAKNELDVFNKENTELQNEVYKLEKEIAILNIQKEALHQESNRNIADSQSKEIELNEFNQVITELKEKLKTKQKKFELSKKQEDELQKEINSTEELITRQKDQLNAESRKLDSKQNEYNLTKSLVDSLEGFPESIRFLKKNANWAKQPPLFSDVIFCKEEYRISIENYLDPVMNHYVVETQDDAIQAIQLLSASSKGRANFFILGAISKTHKTGFQDSVYKQEGLINALDVISVDSKYRPLCELLLHHVYLLQTDEDKELEKALPEEDIIILSSSGKFSKTQTGMSGGSVGLFEGKRIGRAKNLENLAKEIKSLTEIIEKLKNSIDQESEKYNRLKTSSKKQEIQEVQQDINRLNNEFISIKTKQEQYLAFIENSQNRKQDIENKIADINADLLTGESKFAKLKAQKHLKNEKLLVLQQDYNDLADLVNVRSNTYNQENILFHQQQNKVAGIVKDLEYRDVQQKNLENKIAVNSAKLEKIQKEIKDTLQHADHSDEDLTAMYVQKEELEKAVHDLEQDYYASKGLISEAENNISNLRRNKEQSELLVNEIKDRKNNLKLELNALKERLSVEFSVDINDLLDEEDTTEKQTETEDELKDKTVRIKRQLDDFGAINPMAIEAYQEMNERFTFIQTQKKDLIDAKTSLLETIKEIDDTAREKFLEAFTKVRDHFIDVFRSLFNEEDSCDLVLVDPSNPLESDIDILARPKGKRPLSINQLSGGEKTLTATALLFSLYLLKPAPFCIFDEVDAPLDDTNIDKFNNIIRKFSDQSQFIVVSHNKRTIASTDIIYGVTMVEQGVSKVVAVDLREVA